MSKSNLCQRIELCSSIDKLTDDGCIQAIRLLSNILGYKTLNHFLIGIVTKKDGIIESHNHLKQFSIELSQLLSSNQQYIQQSHTYTSHNIKTTKQEQKPPFPLFRLPIDLITKTSFFLNEKDIFQFEQCCRLFYTMINNTKYLKKSYNFKTFIIDNKRFERLTDSQYSFFKCSKANALEFNNHKKGDPDQFFDDMYSEWDKIEKIRTNDGLFDSLFGSIKSLSFGRDGKALLGKMPVKLMFRMDSQLERMELNYYLDGRFTDQLLTSVKEFEHKYIVMQNDIAKKGETMRKLQVIEHKNNDACFNLIHRLGCVSTDHLSVNCLLIDPGDILNVRVLTCKDNVAFIPHVMNGKHDGAGGRGTIQTLRLLNFAVESWFDILNNINVIQSLNLHKSCKNLLLHIDITGLYNDSHEIEKGIKAILKKEYYYSLENVTLLLKLGEFQIDRIFKWLKGNVKILKHQFKKLNIGIYVCGCNSVYQMVEWNPSVDEKFLNTMQAQINKSNADDTYERKYHSMFSQWL